MFSKLSFEFYEFTFYHCIFKIPIILYMCNIWSYNNACLPKYETKYLILSVSAKPRKKSASLFFQKQNLVKVPDLNKTFVSKKYLTTHKAVIKKKHNQIYSCIKLIYKN